MVRIHGERPMEEKEFVRQGGVLVPVDSGHEVGCTDEMCAQDELVEDPLNDDGIPGTPDDLPYDFGVEVPAAVDQQLLSPEHPQAGFSGLGHTGSDEDLSVESPLGSIDERELWSKQRALMQESSDEAPRWGGLEGDDLQRVEDAIGDDAAEVLPDAPEGESATGLS